MKNHFHIREISLNAESANNTGGNVFCICLTKNVLVFYFMHITNRCFIRQNFSFKNRFLLFEIF